MKNLLLLSLIVISAVTYGQEQAENKFNIKYQNYTAYTQMIGSQKDHNAVINSIQMEHNFLLNKTFAFGLSTGIEWMDIKMASVGPNLKIFIPAFNQQSLYIGGSYGAVIPLEDEKEEWIEVLDTKGKHFFNAEAGYIFPSKSAMAFYIAMGYRYQKYSYTRTDWWRNNVERNIEYNRFILKLGIRLF
ncbi:hypothetical protein [Plebeiibacterium sediminum]|uniref:Uncharacterized protein n=1 Tax=Plebeiibacterium sediminum TaxID=2992112 RepID=A0AAE3M7M9_9BACT|nr:hypothetical protein [Plebeiobacterium sediminum]MCW3788674.1 hypothetical protein [Plebeiobacterium sediminum]